MLAIAFAAVALLVPSTTGASVPKHARSQHESTQPWSVSNFDSLITFGDSYTDESRLGWFINHNGTAPPAGSLSPENFVTASGGRTWPRYVIQYTSSSGNGNGSEWMPQTTLYDYAVSGAMVLINQRTVPLRPGIRTPRLPSRPDRSARELISPEPFFTPSLTATSAVYALWIGTNDLGVWAFLTDSQVPGKVLSDYTSCVYEVFNALYASGGRMFVLMNTAPLHLAPLYANASLHGVGANQYWPAKPANLTQIAETMHEYTSTVNAVLEYRTLFENLVAHRYPGARFALFDMYSLISDIYDAPSNYLNGTGVLDGGESVWGYENDCDLNQTVCVKRDNGTNSDAFLWFDELHPR
ncbi:hypothetical protein A1O1_08044 [Capronia coronata CBS 617.96]|uniref:Uncharacterized protein n=1 Tax=Capronia coronata CBS 617.96 TaxID=1182541 RepID=W9XN67_9EURO|nr:uncharacterized protein A1O1_08044 [Capronia coronata CBS 617.96]EXJ81977.1 hypothetical protein A1O1_08044 [Capronia coronata CBS 617.96]